MPDLNIGGILSYINSAKGAVSSAISLVSSFKDAGTVLSSDSEQQIETAIAELEAMLPDLRAKTQAKLRGTGG